MRAHIPHVRRRRRLWWWRRRFNALALQNRAVVFLFVYRAQCMCVYVVWVYVSFCITSFVDSNITRTLEAALKSPTTATDGFIRDDSQYSPEVPHCKRTQTTTATFAEWLCDHRKKACRRSKRSKTLLQKLTIIRTVAAVPKM